MSWKKVFLVFGISMVILSGCNGESAEERIHNHLEEAVVLEQEFETQQKEITELEQQEQEIYATVIDLGMDDFDEIQSLSQDAIEVIDERDEKIEIERESLMQAKEEFTQIEEILEDIDEEEVRTIGNTMYETMIERYDTYDILYDAYKESLGLEAELYQMIQEEDLNQEELNEHIEQINAKYEEILEANDTFNDLTVEYNDLKQEFYNEASIQVAESTEE
jgi:hypothetical protein